MMKHRLPGLGVHRYYYLRSGAGSILSSAVEDDVLPSAEPTHEGDRVGETQSIVAAPPQGDLASIGFKKAGIANQTGARGRGRRPAEFCKEQTLVLRPNSSVAWNVTHSMVPYLSDKIPEAVFHGQPVKTVAYLRVSTAQQDVRSQRLAILRVHTQTRFPYRRFHRGDRLWQAERKADAEKAFDLFLETYEPKYPKATVCLQKDREELLAFYCFPAPHWQSIRTTNPIESTFATIRHLTWRSRGCLTRDGMLHMMFKLGQCAQKNWRRLRGFDDLAKVITGVTFNDGIEVSNVDPAAA